MHRRTNIIPPLALTAAAALLLAASLAPAAGDPGDAPDGRGRVLYLQACAGCHGADGTGVAPSQAGFDVPLPDFTDCNFAAREPDTDWLAVSHEGGPARAFAEEMPAFGEVLSDEELQLVVDHVRTFCGREAWPRGELNLPRALFTEKAYVEDEAVFTTAVDVENAGAVANEIVYEQRFGTRSQFEVVVPFSFREGPDGWGGGRLGDVALGVKRDVFHRHRSGTIFSLAGEVIVPTGDWGEPAVFEPFASFGQVLPAGAFVHLQGGGEVPMRTDPTLEAFWRGALGKSVTNGRWGRTWSPMVELLGARALASGAATHWDVVPQVQVTLNRRQNIMASVGVRLPVDDSGRDAQVVMYLLWDWFDGGLNEGW